MPNSRGAALARIAATHPGQLVAVAGGLGYLLGYINLRAMAAGLGVGPADLELITSDYLMSAAFWVLIVTPVLAVSLWLRSLTTRAGWKSYMGLLTTAMAIGAAIVSVVTAATSVSAVWGFVMALVVASTAGIGVWLGGPGVAIVVATTVSLIGTFLPISYESGKQIAVSPDQGNTAPPWLKLVLPVDEGWAQFPTGDECTLRISDRVYVTDTTVRVEPAQVAFQSRDCFPRGDATGSDSPGPGMG